MRSPWPGTGHVNRNYGDLSERGYGRSGPPLSGQKHHNTTITIYLCIYTYTVYIHKYMVILTTCSGIPTIEMTKASYKPNRPGTLAPMKALQKVPTAELLHMRYGHCHADRIKHLNLQVSVPTILMCGA